MLLGVEGKDWETVVLETSPAFWDLVEARRKEPTLSADELELRIAKSTCIALARVDAIGGTDIQA